MRRGAAEASGTAASSACERGNAVGLTSILDRGQFFNFSLDAVELFVWLAAAKHLPTPRSLVNEVSGRGQCTGRLVDT